MDIIKVEKSKLTVVKGKTAAGKTMALLVDAKDYIDFKMGVLLFTLEQPATKLLKKFFNKVRAKADHSDYMHVVDMAFTLKSIEDIIENVPEGIDIVYIDSLENIKVEDDVENKYQYIVSRLVKLAKKKELPIVITTQVSQANDSITNFNNDAIVDEIRELFENEDDFNNSIKHIVLRDFSGFESYDYFSSTVNLVEPDRKVSRFSTFNLSDYFNN